MNKYTTERRLASVGTDVVDDLVTEDPFAALSANQGVVLREMHEDFAADTITNAQIDAIII